MAFLSLVAVWIVLASTVAAYNCAIDPSAPLHTPFYPAVEPEFNRSSANKGKGAAGEHKCLPYASHSWLSVVCNAGPYVSKELFGVRMCLL
jgi:hypothetical protein